MGPPASPSKRFGFYKLWRLLLRLRGCSFFWAPSSPLILLFTQPVTVIWLCNQLWAGCERPGRHSACSWSRQRKQAGKESMSLLSNVKVQGCREAFEGQSKEDIWWTQTAWCKHCFGLLQRVQALVSAFSGANLSLAAVNTSAALQE